MTMTIPDVHDYRDEPAIDEAGSEYPPPTAPMSVARQIINEHYTSTDDVVTLHYWHGSFWRWATTRWAEVSDQDIRAQVYHTVEHAFFVNDKGETVAWKPNRYKITDVLDALRAVVMLPDTVTTPSWIGEVRGMPPADQLVAAENGLLHVATRLLYPHTPTYFNQVAVPFAYDHDAPAPRQWQVFMGDLWGDDPECISVLAEFFGYVISGLTNLQKILLLIGPSRGGKGMIARVLSALVGGNHAGPTLASLGTNFGLSPLIGKPLAVISDARLSGNTGPVVERLLSISGEDVLTIDRKYREPWTGTLATRILLISNELPRFGDASGAITGRFLVLQLTRSWLGQEDPNLANRLLGELPGIFNWALDALERLRGRGRFTEPRSSADAVVALQDLVSPIAAFVRDRCARGGDLEVACDSLFSAWKVWAEENGQRQGSAQVFGRDLRAVVPGLRVARPRDGASRQRVYRGISISTTRTNNATDRGPLRTVAAVHDGPRSTPLLTQVTGGDGGGPDGALGSPPTPNLGTCRRCRTTGAVDGRGEPICRNCTEVPPPLTDADLARWDAMAEADR